MPSRPLRLAPFVPPALLLLLVSVEGCGASRSAPRPEPAAALQAAFPGHAAEVLSAGTGFARTASGFAGQAGRWLAVELPGGAAGAIVLRERGRSIVSVREIGASGGVRAAERSVAYAREGGASFWTALAGGAEEWLHFDAGAVRDGVPAATWRVEGARIVQAGDAVDLVDEGGAAHLEVTAPAAFAEGGAKVAAWLRARGATLELYVDAGGRGVLVDPKWTFVAPLPGTTGSTGQPAQRENHIAVALADGRVMVVGGDDGNEYALPAAELYDPTMNQWKMAAAMSTARSLHTGTTLKSGHVIVAGGESGISVFNNDAEIYDPTADAWASTVMPNDHAGHTATLLKSGAVLLAGGQGPGSCGGTITTDNVDLYDPTLGLGMGGWGATTHMSSTRVFHAACLLTDGTVLVTGGTDTGGNTLATSEIYDPTTTTWTPTPQAMASARENHQCATLADGTVLVAGGDATTAGLYKVLSSAEIYDPVAQTWSSTASMKSPRTVAQMSVFPGGQVIIVGGDDGNGAIPSTEIYDPVGMGWSAGPPLNLARELSSLTAIGTTFLAAGGWNGNTVLASTEIIDLGLPLGAPCTVASACASATCTEGVCCDQVCTGKCTSCLASVTGGSDGTCGPAPAGSNPGNACTYSDASTCGMTGVCDGHGACALYPDGTVCVETSPCIVAVCSQGVCGGPNVLDGTPCNGGVCIAGTCLPDPSAGSGSSSGGGSGTTTTSGETPDGGTGGTAGTGGQQPGEGSNSADASGSGCGTSPGLPGGSGVMTMLLGLLAAARRRRR